MFEQLIERRTPKSIGEYETLTPTSGFTGCPIISGSYPYTYDGSTTSECGFNPTPYSCLHAWEWKTPVNLIAIQIFTNNYHLKNVHFVNMIQAKVNGSWVKWWEGYTNLNNGAWHTINMNPNNCTGIMLVVEHNKSTYIPRIREIRILYEAAPPPPPPEGEAAFIGVTAPSEFTPNIPFNIKVTVKNTGGTDSIFSRIRNQDTSEILKEHSVTLDGGKQYVFTHTITLSQTTYFHCLIEIGHEESVSARNFLIIPGGC